ncbi:MAG: hypothetical protein M1828_002110 [Chrysothrix sp. TS-e1954]|nr:MAG: hypothetical protein M1828_002110 [Chrysothrix sp. TS-e1954]
MSIGVQPSALDEHLQDTTSHLSTASNFRLHELALQVQHNLQYQHDWTALTVHTASPVSSSLLPRPMISGVPPRRVYVHPDEQVELIKAGISDDQIEPQREWVLPSHLQEHWNLRKFSDAFDNVSSTPPTPRTDDADNQTTTVNEDNHHLRDKWRKIKRLLLASVDNDSTIVYYVVHDGIVKPRQN